MIFKELASHASDGREKDTNTSVWMRKVLVPGTYGLNIRRRLRFKL